MKQEDYENKSELKFEDVALSILFGVLMVLFISFGVYLLSAIVSSWIGKIIIGGALATWYYYEIPFGLKKN